MSRLHLTGILGFATFVYGVVLVIVGIAVDLGALRYFTTVVGVVGIGLGAFERWIWKLPFLHPWLVPFPDISGTWQGRLTSSYDGPIGSKYRDCFLVVRQTFSRVGASLMTEQSESRELAAAIYRDNADGQTLAVLYQNVARLQHRERSPMQRGGMILHIRGDPPYQLDGEYWTTQKTIGEIEFKQRRGQRTTTFEEAAALFASQGKT